MTDRIFFKLLTSAEDVRFVEAFRLHLHPISYLKEALAPNLRCLEFLSPDIYQGFLKIVLSKYCQLQALIIKVEPRGKSAIVISHQKLELLDLECTRNRPLTINCSSLTHLFTCHTDVRKVLGRWYQNRTPPAFHCPHLTTLRLAPVHTTAAVLQSLAAMAPIESLEVHSTSSHNTTRILLILRTFRSSKSTTTQGFLVTCSQIGPFSGGSH